MMKDPGNEHPMIELTIQMYSNILKILNLSTRSKVRQSKQCSCTISGWVTLGFIIAVIKIIHLGDYSHILFSFKKFVNVWVRLGETNPSTPIPGLSVIGIWLILDTI